MAQKILYAVQAKSMEDMLTAVLREKTNGAVVNVGTAGYREQVIPALKQSAPDILIYREGLKGGLDIFKLMREIREEFPNVRIIFLATRQETASKLLCSLVFLGIYDIINGDSIPIEVIIDHVLHPHNFADVAKYFHPAYMDEYMPDMTPAQAAPAADTPKPKGFLSGFMKGFGGGGKPAAAAPLAAPAQPTVPEPHVPMPSVDLESLRGAMLEDARRQAQQEVGRLVADQVMAETAALKDDVAEAKETIGRLTADLHESQVSESQLKLQLEDAVKMHRNAEERLAVVQEQADITNQQYQAQLLKLQTTKPPEWYHEQTQKWLAERGQYKAQISQMEAVINQTAQQLQAVQDEKTRLERDLAERDEKIGTMALAVPRDVSTAIDAALDDDFVIIQDNESEYRQPITGEGQLVAFMGTKHGAGNTTVALNTAVALANAGFKTCFIELNKNFPMVL